MTTRWRPEYGPTHLYFVTSKAIKYRHLFRRDLIKRIVVDILYSATAANRSRLYAFVVMPNHIHVLVQCAPDFDLADWVRVVKSSVSQLLVRQYEIERNESALAWLAAQVVRPEKQKYKVWEDGYLAKDVVTTEFMLEKLRYIHENPVQPHWELADSPVSYAWSSAAFYEGGACLIPIANVYDLLE